MLDFSAAEIEAVRLSLRIAFWAMVGSLPFGLATAIVLARGRFYGKSLLDGVVHLPLVMPPVVTGYLLLLLFGRNGPLGRFLDESFGIVFAFRWTGAALACAVMGFPLLVRAIRLSLEAVDRRLEEAAGTLGAKRIFVFVLVTLPLIAPGIVAGMVLSFARSLGEFGATITFVSNIPGRDPDDRLGDIHPDPNSGRRCRRAETHSRLDSAVICRAARCRSPGKALGPAPFRRLKPMLEVDIEHRLADFALDIHFQAGRGLTALFGRSGAGKTSVVNAIAGLLRPRRGRIVMDGSVLLDTERGICVPTHRRRVGYVFQEGRLFPHLTVRQNLMFGRWFAPARERRATNLDDIVDLLGIAELLDRRPGRLSGGEKQRVAIGRALLASPRLLLMDEPLASLDARRKDEILPYLERLRDEARVPIVYVSHSIAEVTRLATTIVLISAGRVHAVGPVQEVMGRAELYPLAGRFEAGAVLGMRIAAHDPRWSLTQLTGDFGRLTVPRLDAPVGTALRVRIRARDVILAVTRPTGISALNVLAAEVERAGSDRGGGARSAAPPRRRTPAGASDQTFGRGAGPCRRTRGLRRDQNGRNRSSQSFAAGRDRRAR